MHVENTSLLFSYVSRANLAVLPASAPVFRPVGPFLQVQAHPNP